MIMNGSSIVTVLTYLFVGITVVRRKGESKRKKSKKDELEFFCTDFENFLNFSCCKTSAY